MTNLLEIPLGAATINRGSELLGSGIVVNDWITFCGFESTAAEMNNIEKMFKLEKNKNF